eukprot:1152659-Pelagomonas_calceolata.AAC.4
MRMKLPMLILPCLRLATSKCCPPYRSLLPRQLLQTALQCPSCQHVWQPQHSGKHKFKLLYSALHDVQRLLLGFRVLACTNEVTHKNTHTHTHTCKGAPVDGQPRKAPDHPATARAGTGTEQHRVHATPLVAQGPHIGYT